MAPLRHTFALSALLALLPLLGAGPAMAGREPQLRVLLAEEDALRVVPAEGPLLLRSVSGERLGLLEQGVTLRADDDRIVGLPQPLAEVWLEPQGPEGSFWLQQRRYSGSLRLRARAGRLQAVNRLGVERYLASVVGSEMPARWPLEALRVQAVAARTYALRLWRPGADVDLGSTVSHQVYRGLEAETESTRAAVATTRSLVLTHRGQLIDSVFFSSSGGMTENSGEVWPRQLPYLRSVVDYDQDSPVYRWTVAFDDGQLQSAFPETGGASSIEPISQTSTGRLRQVLVRGPGGELSLSGGQLRQRLGLRSSFVRFRPPEDPDTVLERLGSWLGLRPALVAEGRGYGHGVGMSQWGTYGMALKGVSFDRILAHYYSNVNVQPYRPLALVTAAGPAWPQPPPPP
jgi:stage II sporulation protein D